MSYPPQPPGSYGGQQPPPYGQSAYQGLGTFSGGQPPKKTNTGKIVAIVLIVLLAIGGGGVALVVLTKDDDKPTAADDNKTSEAPATDPSDEPSDGASQDQDTDEPTDTGDEDPSDAVNTPDDVRAAYMAAYENKSFGEVVDDACRAYKTKYGTDTADLEKTLEPYQVTATPNGEPHVNGNTARANIDLELSQGGTTERPKIFIKMVEEDGAWRFCGEGEA